MKRKLLRWWYKLMSPHPESSLINHYARGKFRVKYPDGVISQPFGWKTAKNYKVIFDGEIIDNF